MFKKLFQRSDARPSFSALAPDGPFTALGDLHGRADLLARFLAARPAHPVICVGDYVDRGDDSAQVLRMLHADTDIICLSGNHEEMMLDFLDEPRMAGPRWLRNGGLQTLASFGIAGVTESSGAEVLETSRDGLREAMGADLIAWMRALPAYWQSGNVAVVHAGGDPALPLARQSLQSLHWGHADFARTERQDGLWLLHGHTIVGTPRAEAGRIAIDTGAYATGRLTAARVAENTVTFDTIT